MPRGVVKYFSEHRGYGYISCEDATSQSSDVYLHYSRIVDRKSVIEGQVVSFDLRRGHYGLEAVNVEKLA